MASVDLTSYVDLTLFDVDTQSLVERGIETIGVTFPEWDPRESDTEMVLLEALAVEASETVYAINRVPGAVVEVLLRLFGLTKDEGARATASATFTVQAGPERVIPSGTSLTFGTGPDATAFATDVGLTIPAGATSGTVAITATDIGSTPNGTPAGTRLEVVDSIAYVDGAVLATDVAGGREPEADHDFLDRGTTMLSRLTTTLVLPEHFTAAALDDVRVSRAFTVDMYDPTQAPPADRPGHVTVAVLGPDGVPLSGEVKAELESSLESMAIAILDVHVVDAPVTTVDIAVTVTRQPFYTDEQVEASVEAALRSWLDPDTWPYQAAVWRNEIVSVVDQAEGVARVVDVTTPTTDITLTGVGALVRAGTITVTVAGLLA